ncbi:MAG: glycerate kinase, partial [Glutamicibacter sp.]
NPLLGAKGAAAIFGPQKGASENDVQVLDQGLAQLADVLEADTGRALREQPGMGAAGGIAVSLGSYFEVELVPGWDLVAKVLGAHEILADADLVITGEGRLDAQSLDGKVVSGVLQAAGEQAEVIVVAGSVQLSDEQLEASGILAAYSIAPGPATLAELSADTMELAERTAFSVARTFLR